MPTYVYECACCGEFEVQQSIAAPALRGCPECGGEVRRVIVGGVSFIVRGRRGAAGRCERQSPCCGRETRCDKPPCGK